jgi:phosphate transport system substrate-binding protein
MTRYRNALLLAGCAFLCIPAAALEITGAGSSAAAPLYAKWASAYQQQSGTAINYQPIGSSGGLKQIKAGATDFGGSDVALSREESQKEKLICFPSAISGVVPVLNLPGMKSGDVQLTGELLAGIFGRKILFWNDPTIAAVNPDIKLPKTAIVVIVREDGSGTTYNFTDYLSKVSPSWKQDIGTDFKVEWPEGNVQVKGSSAVSHAVRQTVGAIGYIDYSYVLQNQLIYAKMKNRAGQFVAPSAFSFESALASSSWTTKANFEEMLTNQAGRNSWPITMGTFVIVRQTSDKPDATIATLKFFTWAFMKGDGMVSSADFVRLPDRVQARIYSELTKIIDREGKPLRWNLM